MWSCPPILPVSLTYILESTAGDIEEDVDDMEEDAMDYEDMMQYLDDDDWIPMNISRWLHKEYVWVSILEWIRYYNYIIL